MADCQTDFYLPAILRNLAVRSQCDAAKRFEERCTIWAEILLVAAIKFKLSRKVFELAACYCDRLDLPINFDPRIYAAAALILAARFLGTKLDGKALVAGFAPPLDWDEVAEAVSLIVDTLAFDFGQPVVVDFFALYRAGGSLSRTEQTTAALYSDVALFAKRMGDVASLDVAVVCVALARAINNPPAFWPAFRSLGCRSCDGALCRWRAVKILRTYEAIFECRRSAPPQLFDSHKSSLPTLAQIGALRRFVESLPELAPAKAEAEPCVATPLWITDKADYQKRKVLGEGAFGKVYEIDSARGIRALKKYKHGLTRDFMQETTVASAGASPFLLAAEAAGFDEQPLLIMERCETDLQHTIRHVWPPENTEEVLQQARGFARDIVAALAYIHSLGLLHLDIKSNNFLICGGVAKLGDFGHSRWVLPPYEVTTDSVFVPHYRPPEHLLGLAVLRPSADLWAAGCIMIEMAARANPFRAKSKEAVLAAILAKLGDPSPAEWASIAGGSERLRPDTGAARDPSVGATGVLRTGESVAMAVAARWLRYDPDDRVPAVRLLADYFVP